MPSRVGGDSALHILSSPTQAERDYALNLLRAPKEHGWLEDYPAWPQPQWPSAGVVQGPVVVQKADLQLALAHPVAVGRRIGQQVRVHRRKAAH